MSVQQSTQQAASDQPGLVIDDLLHINRSSLPTQTQAAHEELLDFD